MGIESSGAEGAAGKPRHDLRRSQRVPNGSRRRQRLTVYLTQDERAQLEARAQLSGESMAKILVDCALHPVETGDRVEPAVAGELVALLRSYRRQLVGVTTNLNQIAHHANAVSEVPADFAAVVTSIQCLHDEVNDILAGVRR